MTPAEQEAIHQSALANPFLKRLSAGAMNRLLALGQKTVVAPGAVLVQQGDVSDCAFLVLDGELDVRAATSFGEVSLAVVSRGALIGEIGVFADLPRTATIRARNAVQALRFERADLHRAADDEPAFLRSIITRLGGQIGTFNRAIGMYSDALSALEQDDFDLAILNKLRQPVPELMDFSQHFCRMAEQIVLRRARQAEMASAAAIQRAMLPETLPVGLINTPFDIHAHMKPAREVGGDLYDVFFTDPDHLVITIGDVCGKGVPASLFMAITQTVMRTAVHLPATLQGEIKLANALLVAGNREMMFATLFCCVLELSTGKLTYCNCGHNAPLLLRSDATLFENLPASGPPLGIDETVVYTTGSLLLSPGDHLFLYTDGVTEAENPQAAQFETARLETALLDARDRLAREIVELVIDRVTAFSNGAPQFDDITCLSLKFTARG